MGRESSCGSRVDRIIEIQGGAPVCPCHCHPASTHPGQIPALKAEAGLSLCSRLHNTLSHRHVRLRTSDTVTHCTLVPARVLKVTFVSPRPPIYAQTTPLRYTTRHGTKTPGPEVGVKPNLAWQPERAVTAGTRADEPRPPRATQQPRKRFQQLTHT